MPFLPLPSSTRFQQAPGKWFLSLYIPTVVLVFFAIPPVVLILQLALLDEGMTGVARLDYAYTSQLLGRFSGANMARALGLVADNGAVKTQRGCTCQFPFDFGGETQYNCTAAGGEVRDGKGQPSMWCDTGPFCGQEYHASDKPFTNRDCCYDLCVDNSGATIRPNGPWHQEAKRITADAAAAGTLPT